MIKQFLFSALTCFIIFKAYATTPPKLFNFRIEDNNTDRIYFDSSQPITASNANGFIVSGNSISSVTINANKTSNHYFTVNTPFTFWDNNTIRYEGGSDFKNGNQTLKQFTLQYIPNNINEPQANNYLYVAVNGNDENNGKTEANAFKTITKAVSIATSGTTIWVKAGNYGSENISLKSGEMNAPIKIIGYKNTIGDINSMYFKYSKEAVLNASEMPLLDGGNRSTGTAMTLTTGRRYIMIKNFQLKNYKNGFYGNGVDGVIIDNCIAKDLGTDKKTEAENALGRAIYLSSSSKRGRILKSIAINSTMHNIYYAGSFGYISKCKSYCNDKRPEVKKNKGLWATDYYFSLSGENNISRETYSLRDGFLPHSGHGFSIDTKNGIYNTQNNLIEKHTGINCAKSLALRGDKVAYNIVRRHKAYQKDGVVCNGIQIREGANNNIIEAAYINDVSYPTTLATTNEVGPGTAYNNIYVNCVFSNFNKLIYPFFSKDSTDTTYDNPEVIGNKYLNCTIYNSSELISKDNLSKIENNEFINCNFVGVKSAGQTKGWSFKNCNFYDGFTVDNTGDNSGNINESPNFIDADSPDKFKLNSDSPLKDKGLAVNELFAFDYDGVFRPQGNGVDIGAFEIEETLTTNAKNTIVLGCKLYPNPTNEVLNIQKNNTNTISLSLLNVSGAILYRLDNITGKNTSINLSQYARGIYFVKLESKNDSQVKKIILQ